MQRLWGIQWSTVCDSWSITAPGSQQKDNSVSLLHPPPYWGKADAELRSPLLSIRSYHGYPPISLKHYQHVIWGYHGRSIRASAAEHPRLPMVSCHKPQACLNVILHASPAAGNSESVFPFFAFPDHWTYVCFFFFFLMYILSLHFSSNRIRKTL